MVVPVSTVVTERSASTRYRPPSGDASSSAIVPTHSRPAASQAPSLVRVPVRSASIGTSSGDRSPSRTCRPSGSPMTAPPRAPRQRQAHDARDELGRVAAGRGVVAVHAMPGDVDPEQGAGGGIPARTLAELRAGLDGDVELSEWGPRHAGRFYPRGSGARRSRVYALRSPSHMSESISRTACSWVSPLARSTSSLRVTDADLPEHFRKEMGVGRPDLAGLLGGVEELDEAIDVALRRRRSTRRAASTRTVRCPRRT